MQSDLELALTVALSSKQLLTSANSISHRQDVGGLHLDLVGVADDGGELYHEQYDEHGVKIEVRRCLVFKNILLRNKNILETADGRRVDVALPGIETRE